MAKKAKSKSRPRPKARSKPKSRPKPKVHKAKAKVHKAKPKSRPKPKAHKAVKKHAPSRHTAPARPSALDMPRRMPEHHIVPPIPTSIVPAAPVMVVPQGAPIPPAQVDRVHLQNISFEIASMRRALERMLEQLDALEEDISEKKRSGE